MKKIYLFTLLLSLSFAGIDSLNAQISGVNVNTLTDSQIFSAVCDETEYYQIYKNSTAILVDNFVNTSGVPFYLWRYQIRTTGNYLLYNKTSDSKYPLNSALLTWNRPLIEQQLSWKVNPGKTVRHLTMYEEDGDAIVKPEWTLGSPFFASADGKQFNNANIRNPGTTPTNPTKSPAYDDEVRVLTEYDVDNNGSTMSDAKIVVECARYNIRWCGDGLKTNSEVCDPADTSHSGWGNGGCDTSCKPINNPPENGVCSTTVTGPQDTQLTTGACEKGSVINFNHTGTNPINYTWNCSGINGGNTSPVCRASHTPPPPTATCDSLTVSRTTGPAPLSVDVSCTGKNVTSYQIVCAPGQVINARTGTCTYATPGTYTPRCTVNGNITSPACTKTVTVNPPPVYPDLAIKKYAKYLDSRGDTQNAPVQLEPGEAFNYYYTVENSGAAAAIDVIVKDTFPEYISWNGNVTVKNPAGTDVTADWDCVKGTYPGTTRVTLVCTKNTPLPARSGKYTFTIPVKLDPAAPTGTDLRNIAYVCADNDSNPDDCTNTPPPPPPNDCDDPLPPGVPRDPACVEVGGNFDLSLKKLVKSQDVFALVNPTEDFDYNIEVTNNGTGSSTGATIVRDILPSPVILQAGKVPSGNGWTCTRASDRDFTCTYTGSIKQNQLYPTITVPARVTNLAFRREAYVNYAYVYNPYEKIGKRCRTDGAMPNPTLAGGNGEHPEYVCDEDSNNFDPATISTANPNGFDLELHKYVNDDDEASRPNANGSIKYTFRVRNNGVLASSGRTYVRDTDFPVGIMLVTIEPSQNGWTCGPIASTVGNGQNGFECYRDDSLAAGDEYPDITVYAQAQDGLASGRYRNVACLSNPNDPHESAPYDPDLGQYKVNNCNPALVVVVPPGTFDLTIVKKVGNNLTDGSLKDRNTTNEGDGEQDILIIGKNAPLVYTFDVRNLGPVTATGTTTVEDTLPEGIIASSVIGDGWSCAITGNGSRSWRCTRTTDLAVGASFPTITLTANSSAAALVGVYSNIATVSNPGDTNPTNNSDPANVKIVVDPTCGSLTANPNISPNNPNTPITYTCAAVGYTGNPTNLEYNITCGSSDLGWSGSATRICPLPASNDTTQVTTCKIQDKTNSGVIFTGSMIGACRNELKTTGGGCVGGCGPTYFGKKCVNGVPTCGVYSRLDDCMANKDPSAPQCYIQGVDGDGLAQCRANAPTLCGGPPTSGRCGDGVLTLPEQCDLGDSMNGAPGSACSRDCKLNTITNPGENPLTALWMTIPTLSNARLGYSFTDIIPGEDGVQIAFSENSLVVGSGTRLFTLADTVGFGLKTELPIPLIIPYDQKMCLTGSGQITNQSRCSWIGRYTAGGNYDSFDNGTTKYIVMGVGDYQVPLPDGTYELREANYSNNVTLFKGAELYGNKNYEYRVSLRDAFFGGVASSQSELILETESPSHPGDYVDLVHLTVVTSDALVGTTAGTVNRKVESYIHAGNLVNLFLSGIKSNTTTTANTQTAGNTTATAEVNVSAVTASPTIDAISDLDNYKLNGNPNIFSIKGDVTIAGCQDNILRLDGIRTLLVEGDLIIKCNIVYANADASWAFIVKGGDIQVYNGSNGIPNVGAVTNLAGVYVAIDGYITYTGAATTQAILKIDGSLYGDADDLFNSRLYVRGTNAYEILTTGVVLSYSNRALVSPPPLLSSYLNNYSVTRVVK